MKFYTQNRLTRLDDRRSSEHQDMFSPSSNPHDTDHPPSERSPDAIDMNIQNLVRTMGEKHIWCGYRGPAGQRLGWDGQQRRLRSWARLGGATPRRGSAVACEWRVVPLFRLRSLI